jgi:hypothetical protein
LNLGGFAVSDKNSPAVGQVASRFAESEILVGIGEANVVFAAKLIFLCFGRCIAPPPE